MKATSIFGGVGIISIVITIVRTKFVAVLLGPTGIGINNLLSSTISLVGQVTSLSLGTSAVRNIAAAHATGDVNYTSKTVAVLRRLVWITGGLGMILTIALSPWLSKLAFGNYEYTIPLILISVTLLINQISIGQGVILQGMRKLNLLAKASLLGAVFGLVISVPLYYMFGLDGIVPAIILVSLASLAVTWFFSRKIKLPAVSLTKSEMVGEGKSMVSLGFMIGLKDMFSQLRYFVIKVFISNVGGLAQVGFYTAGIGMVNTYSSVVFSAMTTDYYPRLASVAENEAERRTLINQQAEMAILLLGPLLCIFLTFSGFIISVLLSSEFHEIVNMVQWAALGIYFKAASWSIAFLFLAKGDNKMFFWNTFISQIIMLIFYYVGYSLAGLTGLGFGFMLSFVSYTLQVYLVTNWKYRFTFTAAFIKIFILQFLAGLSCLFLALICESVVAYLVSSIIILLTIAFTYLEMNKRIEVKSLLKRLLRR